jgi:hypothetical protein
VYSPHAPRQPDPLRSRIETVNSLEPSSSAEEPQVPATVLAQTTQEEAAVLRKYSIWQENLPFEHVIFGRHAEPTQLVKFFRTALCVLFDVLTVFRTGLRSRVALVAEKLFLWKHWPCI